MPWYKALLLVIYSLLTIAALFAVPFAICRFIDKHVDKYRRKKYPEYYELYDAVVKESFEVGEEFKRRYDHITFHFRLWTDGLKNGECTDEAFADRMSKLTEEYQELCGWYTTAAQYLNDLWKQVDRKAKEIGFKKGTIYDD